MRFGWIITPKYLIIITFALSLNEVYSQNERTIEIDSCYKWARHHYPLLKQNEWLSQAEQLNHTNVGKQYLPQINIGAQATYQSDVTKLPINIPNMVIPELSKDQYKIYAELTQTLTGAFTIRQQQIVAQSQYAIEQQKNEVELYKVYDQIQKLYFGILLNQNQEYQTLIIKKDLDLTQQQIESSVREGLLAASELLVLKAESVKLEQRLTELKYNRIVYFKMLSIVTGQTLDEQTVLTNPKDLRLQSENNRPELSLFDYQKANFLNQSGLINRRKIPLIQGFAQFGYGRPGMNMLSNDFGTYFIGGLRLNWNLGQFYTSGKEHELVQINRNMMDTQKETFEQNIDAAAQQFYVDIDKYERLLQQDDQLIQIRTEIKNAYQSKLTLGAVLSNDYIEQSNALDQALQSKLLHQTQKLIAQHQLAYLMGQIQP